MKKLLSVSLLVSIFACAPPNAPVEKDPPPRAAQAATIAKIPVQTTRATIEDVKEILELTGTAHPFDEITISSEIAGRVVQIHVREGQFVKKSQLLVELDAEKLNLERQAREAELARARVELEYARKRLARAESLLEKGAMSQSEVDTLEQAVQVAQATVTQGEATLALLDERINDTRIRSPEAGQVSTRHVSLGEMVTPAVPLFTVIQVDSLKIVTEIAEWNLHSIRPGQEVTVAFDALQVRGLSGVIYHIYPVANRQSGAFPVEIELPNPGNRVQPGMVARLQVAGRIFAGALVIPLDAVLDHEGETHVFVISDDIARRKPIKIERRMGSRAIVSGELRPGDLIVTRGNANLTDGAAVEVLN